MLIVMAGLPGTGKSTLAARLADALGGVVLSKDVVRAALFPPPVLDYSREQDDVAMTAVYAAAGQILRTSPGRAVILDGRTFTLGYQVRDLLAWADERGVAPRLIECVCSDRIARERLERDRERGGHPAGNRGSDLYLARKAAAEPLTVPRLILDTGTLTPAEAMARCLASLQAG